LEHEPGGIAWLEAFDGGGGRSGRLGRPLGV